MAAVVFRVPGVDEPLGEYPEVLGSCFKGIEDDVNVNEETLGCYPSNLAFRVSSNVLESVRTEDKGMIVRSIYSSDREITSAFVHAHSPRVVMCVPLGKVTEGVELLYVDLGVDKTTQDTFAFLQAVAGEIISSR